jgi:hypothetical protein
MCLRFGHHLTPQQQTPSPNIADPRIPLFHGPQALQRVSPQVSGIFRHPFVIDNGQGGQGRRECPVFRVRVLGAMLS